MAYVKMLDSGPLCPYSMSGPPGHPNIAQHRRATEIANVVYEEFADRRDADSELSAEDQKLHDERLMHAYVEELGIHVANPHEIDWMRLYRESASPMSGPGFGGPQIGYFVEAWWFQCLCCGFVLPAQGIQR